MKTARLLVLGIAIVAGGAAAMIAGRSNQAPSVQQQTTAQQPVIQQPSIETTEVLVIATDIPMGGVIVDRDLEWREWPAGSAGNFINRRNEPDARQSYVGSIARQQLANGEPLNQNKLIQPDGSGFLAAILPVGMRAIATEISAETGAGGFILPNDKVDVILTRRDPSAAATGTEYKTSTILRNVRVLAIDQQIQDKDGRQVVIGRTATLQLEPRQTEILALGRQLGTLSLALRPLAERGDDELEGDGPTIGDLGIGTQTGSGQGLTIVRFGVSKEASN